MKIKLTIFLPGIFSLLFFFSCNRDLDILSAPYEPKVVVEGWIESDEYAQVILTLSASFYQQLDTAFLFENIIKSAKVTVSDGINTEILTLGTNNNYLPPYVYYGCGIKGEAGKSYSLEIEYLDKIITSETSIPKRVASIDSCWFVKEQLTDTAGYINIRFTNKSELYYQIATMVYEEETRYTPCLYGNYKAEQFEKEEKVELQINKGPIVFPLSDFNTQFRENKTIYIKLRTQNKEAYDFWTSWQNEIINAKNPIFPAYTNLKSNINGGIGLWTGYGTSQYKLFTQ